MNLLIMTIMIELKNINLRYNNNIILEKYCLKLNNGVYRLIGKSGSGKTSLLDIISNENTLYTGNYNLYGKDISNFNNKELFQKYIAYARQEDDLIDNLTVNENFNIYNININDINISNMIDNFDISSLLKSKVRELSGGERKKVQLIITFTLNTPIIILDEPDNHLDDDSIEYLKILIKSFDGLLIYTAHSDLDIDNVIEIDLQNGYIDHQSMLDLKYPESYKYSKSNLNIKKNKIITILSIILLCSSLILSYSFVHSYIGYIQSFNWNVEETSDFTNPNSIILVPPVDNYYSYLLGSEEWYDKIPFYFSEEDLNKLETNELVQDVEPFTSFWLITSNIYFDDKLYYTFETGIKEFYSLVASYNVISNTNLYGIKEEDINGRFPYDDSNEILITDDFARDYNLEIGDNFTIEGKNSANLADTEDFTYKVVGIYESAKYPYSEGGIYTSYSTEENKSNDHSLLPKSKYRYYAIENVAFNTNQTDLENKINPNSEYYERLYVECANEEDTKKLINEIYEYDPYIEVQSNYELETGYYGKYLKDKKLTLCIFYIIFSFIIMSVFTIFLLINRKLFEDSYYVTLYHAGYDDNDIMRIYLKYSKFINNILFLNFIILALLFTLYQIWMYLIVITIAYTVFIILILKISKRKFKYEYRNK